MFKKVKYEQFPKGSIVFRENEKSNQKYYIILTGEVGFCQLDDKSQMINSKNINKMENPIRSRGSTMTQDTSKVIPKRLSMGQLPSELASTQKTPQGI